MRTWMTLLRAQAMLIVVALVVVGLVGCNDNAAKTSDKPCDKAKEAPKPPPPAQAAPVAKPAPAQPMQPPAHPAPPAQPTPPPPPAQPPKPSAAAQPMQPPPGHPPMPPVQKTSEPPKNPPDANAANTDKTRAETTDRIYAEIRTRMEDMIGQRTRLLKEGKTSADPEVMKLESSILKARELLIQAGEVVADVQPPITLKPPPTSEKK